MKMIDNRSGFEVLDRRECLRLLAGEVVGRVAVVEAGSPLVLPVNFGLDGDIVVFRTGPGTKLSEARGHAACFEVDDFDRETRSGWSVVVRGRMEEVTEYSPALLARLAHLAEPWLDGDRNHVVRIVPTSITGRRVPAPSA